MLGLAILVLGALGVFIGEIRNEERAVDVDLEIPMAINGVNMTTYMTPNKTSTSTSNSSSTLTSRTSRTSRTSPTSPSNSSRPTSTSNQTHTSTSTSPKNVLKKGESFSCPSPYHPSRMVDLELVGIGPEASHLEEVPITLPSLEGASSSSGAVDLWMSAFVTEKRRRRNRFPRIQVCLFVLESYTRLPLENVFLYLEFDPGYGKALIDDARRKIKKLFGDKLKIFSHRRLLAHNEWRQALRNVSRFLPDDKKGELDKQRLMMFTQNDDHAFIDKDTSVLIEGLRRMRIDPSRFTTLYYSHWPELLKLSGKMQSPVRRGSYVVARLTLADSVQICNLGFIKFLIETVPWCNFRQQTNRVDGLLCNEKIAALSPGGTYPPINRLPSNMLLQNIYVPLRELYRKFDAYGVGAHGMRVPAPLLLPMSANTFKYDKRTLQAKMLAVPAVGGPTAWNKGNAFLVREEWVRAMFALYGHKDTNLPDPMYPDFLYKDTPHKPGNEQVVDFGVKSESSRLEDVPIINLSSIEYLDPSPKMDLWMNVYVTEKRSRKNRFPRIQVCLYTLESYTRLPLENAYLYIEFDTAYGDDAIVATQNKIRQLFGDKLKIFSPRRLIAHEDWRQALRNISSPGFKGSTSGHRSSDELRELKQRLILFTQNDDHVFIDKDTDVLVEGLRRMRLDPARFSTLYYSHWPEILKVSGKLFPPVRRGSYVVARLTLSDAVQICNFGFVKFLIETVPWRKLDEKARRVDNLLVHQDLWQLKSSFPGVNVVKVILQNIYIPLRELFRKFDGYHAQHIHTIESLVLPPNANKFSYDKKSLQSKMLAVPAVGGSTLWNKNNNFLIPEEWVRAMFALYGNNDTRLVNPVY
ncbi:hypothetical protein AAMO2058_000096500 [Amorphochlora amoebiformis]